MNPKQDNDIPLKKPAWLKRRLPSGSEYERVRSLLGETRLHTVCQEAKCPNLWECFSCQTATFLIMGDRCTRDCRFCAVKQGRPDSPDPGEPARVADAVKKLDLEYVVITSVTRDDLPDGGASCFARTIEAIRHHRPGILVEVLIPDFQGDTNALETVVGAGPDVLNHNMETVERLYPEVRPAANYRRSLDLIARVRDMDPDLPTKSGLMLGLGEGRDEIQGVLEDLLAAGCRILTLGQYLQPTKAHLPVRRFVPPEEFEAWRASAVSMGFREVASGPFVRSSYHAGELYRNL